LVHAAAHPGILDTNTVAALTKIAQAGLMNEADARLVLGAARLQQALTQILRIALDETLETEKASAGLKVLLADAGGARDFAGLEQELGEKQAAMRAVFTRLMAG